jgi:hypothetical protein
MILWSADWCVCCCCEKEREEKKKKRISRLANFVARSIFSMAG